METREAYFAGDRSYSDLQQVLLNDPKIGPVMPGCNGLRKIRRPDPRRGMGKRGGLRIIYLHVPEKRIVLLIKVYDKNETDNLAPSERKELALFAEELRRVALLRR